MQEIIDWLKNIEQRASDLYKIAASLFEEDEELSEFLSRLSDDEARHYEIIEQASEYLQRNEIHALSDIILDQHTRDHIEAPLKENYDLLCTGELSKKQIINCIVETEYSEWNDIFLYVINNMKKFNKEFQYLVATIQEHKNRIVHFIDNLPGGFKIYKDIHELDDVWQNKFLLVEDNEAILTLFEEILAMKGAVETAVNGQEGLKKIREHFFNVIISDIDMPIMDGLELYKKAVEENKEIKAHFLFCSGNITSNSERFLMENNLPYLTKPVALDEFIQAVEDIAKKTSEHI